MNKMDIYYKLPVIAQNLACYYEGRRIMKARYSYEFWRYLEEYESRNNWKYEQLIQYRDSKLQRMIKHCYETVPYYKKMFDKKSIDYRTIKTKDDLQVLPILTKELIKTNPNDFISTAISKDKLKIHPTGGTTGSGLSFYTTDEEEAEQWAVWWRYRRNLGIGFDMWCGNFGGKTVVSINNKKPPFWRYNTPGKQVFFSGYHINEQNAPYYAEEIIKRNIKWLHGYPSNLANLASCLLANGIKLNIKYITIGSENLYEYQMDLISKAFNTTPYHHYGLTEGVANISQKLDGNLYIDEDFSVVEFINIEDALDSIIGTSLTNWAMPLIRYDTGDQAIFNHKEPDNNNIGGRRVDRINGRTNEFVVLKDNSRVSSAALSLVFKDIVSIREAQIVQKEKDFILVRIVKTDTYSSSDEEKTTKALKERLGRNMRVTYEYVYKIPRTKSGKMRLVISEID